MNDEVHRTHCCAGIHGCKYMDDDCPVQMKRIPPQYKCQDCEEGRHELAQRLAAMSPAELDALLRLAGLRGPNVL